MTSPGDEPPHDYQRQELRDLRDAVGQLTTVTAAQNERIAGQSAELEKAHKLIKEQETTSALLRGDLREAYTRITGLEAQLVEERGARTLQATEMGDLRAQLRIADERLKHQRDELTEQAKKIAVLEDERAKYQGLYAGEALAKTALEQDLAAARARIAELERMSGISGAG